MIARPTDDGLLENLQRGGFAYFLRAYNPHN